MSFWDETTINPSTLPIQSREAWHREAWNLEQDELADLTGMASAERPITSVITAVAMGEYDPEVAV
jgi:hypothetical protein